MSGTRTSTSRPNLEVLEGRNLLSGGLVLLPQAGMMAATGHHGHHPHAAIHHHGHHVARAAPTTTPATGAMPMPTMPMPMPTMPMPSGPGMMRLE